MHHSLKQPADGRTGKPANRLLQFLIAISLAVHLLILAKVAGLYDRSALSYIELTLQDVSRPFPRAIPRPRLRLETPRVHDARPLTVRQTPIPRIQIDPAETGIPTLMAQISTPDIPAAQGVSSADWGGPTGEYFSRQDYFDMIRMRIETCKQYPPDAKRRHIEGRVTLRFAVTTDGQVSSLKIIGTPHETLKKAALKAVADAAPFPRPPIGLFKKILQIEIAVVFELT